MESLTGTINIILVFAILIQFCVDRVKEIVGEKVMGYIKAPLWALIFGIIFALVFKIDLFELMGYPSEMPIVSMVVTGLILSSGSSPVHELIEKVRESRVK